MNKLKLESMNMTQHNIDRIAEMFPQVVTEVQVETEIPDPNNSALRIKHYELKKAVDFEKLKLVLSAGSGDYVVADDERERYEFTWVGKRQAMIDAATPIRKTLRPCVEESVNFDTTENMYIEGDNLEVLKLLQESYLGKVKMIYIDPPYNTGKDFVYKDNFKQSAEEYNEESGMYDEEDNKLFQNTETNGRFHSDWCSMIYPRLQLARNLLTDDGVMCISIDDNEIENLKKICDEVFGASNFMTTIAVKMSEPTGMKMAHATTRLPKLKEYILVYTKSNNITINSVSVPKEKWDGEYKTYLKGVDEEEINVIKSIRDNEDRSEIDIKEVNKLLSKISYCSLSDIYKQHNITLDEDKIKFNYDNSWRIIQTVSMTGGAKQLADEKRNELAQLFYSIQTSKKKMYIIKGDYANDIDKPRCKALFANDYLSVNPCDFWQDIKTTGLDNEGYVDFRNGKKPLKLVERLIKLFSNKNDFVMDFFSGSGTTGNAVLSLNKSDISSRKFILVQFPENIDDQILKVDADTKKELKKLIVFLDSINKPHLLTEIGKQRLRLAGNDIMYGDIGFRVFKTDTTNMKDVYYSAGAISQATLFGMESNIKEDRTDIDLLYGALLDWGVELTYPHTAEQIDGFTVHTVDTPATDEIDIIACFDKNISEKAIREIASRKPLRALFRDHSFKDSANKINVYEIFKAVAPDTSVKVM